MRMHRVSARRFPLALQTGIDSAAAVMARREADGVCSTPLDTVTVDKAQAAATEQGQQGGAWQTPEHKRSRDDEMRRMPSDDEAYTPSKERKRGKIGGKSAAKRGREPGGSGSRKPTPSSAAQPSAHATPRAQQRPSRAAGRAASAAISRDVDDESQTGFDAFPPAVLQAGVEQRGSGGRRVLGWEQQGSAGFEQRPCFSAENADRELLDRELLTPAAHPAVDNRKAQRVAIIHGLVSSMNSLRMATDSLRMALVAAAREAKQAQRDKASAIAELEAVRKSAAADAQAAAKAHRRELRELRAAVAGGV
ncbi:hypothetical protein T492DRAFT_1147990 [Pavlovales sp. CCMP2436]|nr:hypothetical protein T492DRAFT_1147990 [Pavlovales sp. CCMP2436]